MPLIRTALAATLVLALSSAASAAPIVAATGTTTVQLGVLPVAVGGLGNAVDNGGGSFSFPVTGVEESGGATTLYHQGSGLQVGPLQLLDFRYTLPAPGTPPSASFPITLFGDVAGVAGNVPLFNIDDELGLSLTPQSGAALGLPAGTPIGNVTGIDFEVTSPVPEPTSLLLLGATLAVAARRLRR